MYVSQLKRWRDSLLVLQILTCSSLVTTLLASSSSLGCLYLSFFVLMLCHAPYVPFSFILYIRFTTFFHRSLYSCLYIRVGSSSSTFFQNVWHHSRYRTFKRRAYRNQVWDDYLNELYFALSSLPWQMSRVEKLDLAACKEMEMYLNVDQGF